jgi:hypothetical protein
MEGGKRSTRKAAMELTEDLFREVSESLTVVGEGETREADRRSPRLQAARNVEIVPWGSPTDGLTVRIRDLSPGGLGILHSERMALDDQFVVRLPRSADQTLLVACTVVYWEPLAENLYSIGAQFQQLISEEELNEHRGESAQTTSGVLARISRAFAGRRKIAS